MTHTIVDSLTRSLVGHVYWQDKRRAEDRLAVTAIEHDGSDCVTERGEREREPCTHSFTCLLAHLCNRWAASNIRKGTAKNICEMTIRVRLEVDVPIHSVDRSRAHECRDVAVELC